ncbi:MAG: glutamate dehydrogenase [Geobacteraceae bacterium]
MLWSFRVCDRWVDLVGDVELGTAERACELLGRSLDEQRCVVQGFGNVGSSVARNLFREGVKIIAISRSKGGYYCEAGINPFELQRYFAEHKAFEGFPGCDMITNDELLALKCDILVPSALENVIHRGNAGSVQASILAEGANGPVTPIADEILKDKGVFILPDILANAGGVTVSYFEWVQDLQNYFWNEAEINNKLRQIMTASFKQVMNIAEEKRIDNRTAANVLGIGRVVEASQLRGLYP